MERLNSFLMKIDLNGLHKFILENGKPASYRRGEIVSEEGKRCPVIAIVRSGYFQFSVINSKGERCITGFSFEGEVMTDYICSFQYNMPSFTSISAGCNATAVQVDINDAKQFIAQKHPDLNGKASSVLLVEIYRRYLDLHTKTPKERYMELFSRCHGNLSLIPLQEMASYLSISRRQLQRIRESII